MHQYSLPLIFACGKRVTIIIVEISVSGSGTSARGHNSRDNKTLRRQRVVNGAIRIALHHNMSVYINIHCELMHVSLCLRYNNKVRGGAFHDMKHCHVVGTGANVTRFRFAI